MFQNDSKVSRPLREYLSIRHFSGKSPFKRLSEASRGGRSKDIADICFCCARFHANVFHRLLAILVEIVKVMVKNQRFSPLDSLLLKPMGQHGR